MLATVGFSVLSFPSRRRARTAAVVAGLFGLAAPFVVLPASAQAQVWRAISAPVRFDHTATALHDGRVLVAGGCVRLDANGVCVTPVPDAQVLDVGRERWSKVAAMGTPRSGHSATALADGKVLVAGGCGRYNPFVCIRAANSAEVYDPEGNTWTPTGPPALALVPQRFADTTATLLPSGGVLVVSPSGSQLFDPATSTWRRTAGQPPVQLVGHTATSVADGAVVVFSAPLLLAQGPPLRGEAVYDAATEAWLPAAPDPVHRDLASATPLGDGTVLVAGGLADDGATPLASAELYDPKATDGERPGAFRPTGSLEVPRIGHVAVALGDGSALVVGGSTAGGSAVAGTERYDPASGRWSPAGSMSVPRGAHVSGTGTGRRLGAASFTATALPGGAVLVIGGATAPGGDLYAHEGAADKAPAPSDEDSGGSSVWAFGLGAGGAVALGGAAMALRRRRPQP